MDTLKTILHSIKKENMEIKSAIKQTTFIIASKDRKNLPENISIINNDYLRLLDSLSSVLNLSLNI
jgi:hypothetical protein